MGNGILCGIMGGKSNSKGSAESDFISSHVFKAHSRNISSFERATMSTFLEMGVAPC